MAYTTRENSEASKPCRQSSIELLRHMVSLSTDPPMYREIGTGSIGKVYGVPGTTLAYKLAMADMRYKLRNNFVMHAQIYNAFKCIPAVPHQVRVPECHFFKLSTSDDFWNVHLSRFPEAPGFPSKPYDVMAMERIFPLPECVREALIDKYCPEEFRSAAQANDANKDCLIRPYFEHYKHGSSSLGFTLRNFRLHIDQIEALGSDITHLCSGMAHAFAVLHWAAEIDGKGLKFVLGTRPSVLKTTREGTGTSARTVQEGVNFRKRHINFWMVDFDKCSKITMNSAGVELSVKAFMETDPYWPQPNSSLESVQQLWQKFRQQYLAHSQGILTFMKKSQFSHLPVEFIAQIEKLPRLG